MKYNTGLTFKQSTDTICYAGKNGQKFNVFLY